MPEMNGIALATQISQERPQIKVLLMSGFTGGMLVLNEGWHFLAKPFIASQLHALIAGLINPEEFGKVKRPGSENFV
jgi:YesN/AraC family two-component response regulator